MNVSFHGIKNVMGIHYSQNPIAKCGESSNFCKTGNDSFISFEVDNNETRDLDKAQRIFAKYGSQGSNRIDLRITDGDKYVLNGESVEFNDENFKVFETLLDFFKQIKKKSPDELIVDDNFDEFMTKQKQTNEKELQAKLEDKEIKLVKSWDPYWAKETAKLTGKTIKANIAQYFEV